jgi:hypothetical protein
LPEPVALSVARARHRPVKTSNSPFQQRIPRLWIQHAAADPASKLALAPDRPLPENQLECPFQLAKKKRGLRALNRHVERVFTSRKEHHWGKRKLARDR